MLYSIANRTRRHAPISEAELKIIRSATKLFLEKGFSHTTISMICEDSGLARGNVVYYFHTKEDMLFLLIQEVMDHHKAVIDETKSKTGDTGFACAMEIAMQISLCENNTTAWDLYYAAYSHQGIFEFIKEWTAKKNHELFKDRLPDWTERDFHIKEKVASHIEFSALTSPCDDDFTIEDKIKIVLDSYMRLYDMAYDERCGIIEKVLATDYKNMGEQVFDKFLQKFYQSIKQE